MRSHSGQVFELIQISDARSLCEGYNHGFAKTRGDIIIFCHDDIEIISPDFPARLLAHLRTHDVVGVAGTTQLIRSKLEYATKFGADKIVQLTPSQINWPIVQFSERADMIAFHRVMVLAQSAAGSHCGQIAAINRP